MSDIPVSTRIVPDARIGPAEVQTTETDSGSCRTPCLRALQSMLFVKASGKPGGPAGMGYHRVLVNHCMSAESLLPWFPLRDGGHWGLNDFRDIVMRAGQDPYTWQDLEDRMHSTVWPSGEGGDIKREQQRKSQRTM